MSFFKRSTGAVLLQLAINGVGKGVGFVREVLISGMFGVSAITDTFFAIQQLLVFVSSYMMGAFNLAFVPAYIKSETANARGAFLRPLVTVLCLGALAASILLAMLGSSQLAFVLGFARPTEMLGQFAEILAWAIVPTVLVGVAFGVLHGERRHQVATMLGSASSVGMLVVLIFYYLRTTSTESRVAALPWSYFLGMLFAALAAVAVLAPRLRPVSNEGSPEFPSFIRALSAASLENVGFNINQLSNVYFAARLGDGLVAINAFAFRVGMLPLALVTSQLGQVYQGWAARSFAVGKHPAKYVFFLLCLPSVFIALAMVMWGEHIVRLVYERGQFGPEQTFQVAALLVPYAAYFLVMSINQLAARHFFVIGKGMNYARLMLSAYGVALLVKATVAESVSAIIWACVVAEGTVAVWLCLQLALDDSHK